MPTDEYRQFDPFDDPYLRHNESPVCVPQTLIVHESVIDHELPDI